MEIEDQDGAKIELPKKAVFGRGSGFISGDKTVSRRHVAFEVETGAKQTEPSVSFEVLGKNPVWVRRGEEDEIRVFRSLEKGRLSEGDRFCVSGNEQTWFALREIVAEDRKTRVPSEDESELGSEFEGFDVSNIDPVKEFGFVVIGREFDVYPRHMIRDPKRWNRFLEENRKESSDEEEEEEEEEEEVEDKPGKSNKKKEGAVKKRKKRGENEDEDWTGSESDSDKEIVERLKSLRKEGNAKHYTRSKGRDKHFSVVDGLGSKKLAQSGDNDEDETLGGFIVGDSQVDQEEEEEEEEFVEDDDE